jgi:hypothetical protein
MQDCCINVTQSFGSSQEEARAGLIRPIARLRGAGFCSEPVRTQASGVVIPRAGGCRPYMLGLLVLLFRFLAVQGTWGTLWPLVNEEM